MEGVTAMAYKETYDTPIPKELRPAYDAWYNQLPQNLQYTGDYDLQGAWLERLGRPTKYEATQNGHLDDYGKKPNHPTFSSGSKWHDPKIPERTGGEWKKADDGTWDFYPGSGNQLSDEELERYFEKHEKGNRVHKRETRSDMEGGESTGESVNSVNEVPEGTEQTVQNTEGPRIIVNPKVFSDKRDALCVAMNEAFRILMEVNGFEPQAEPTPAQRRFFADTAYANDELMLRRTILARICTFDTSIGEPSSGKHTGHSESTAPTDEQLQEAIEFLETVMEIGAPQNQWEQQAVKRIHDVLVATLENGQRVNSEEQPEPPQDENGTVVGDVGGGTANDDQPEDLFQDDSNDSADNGSLDDFFQTGKSTDPAPTETEKLAEQVHNQLKEMADNGKEINGDTSTQVANQIKSGDQPDATSGADTQTATTDSTTAPNTIPGLTSIQGRRGGSASYTYNGRYISQREATRLINSYEGGTTGSTSTQVANQIKSGDQPDATSGADTQTATTDSTTAPNTIPGLTSIQGRRGGSASYTYNGRYISQREAEKLTDKFGKM